MAKLPSSTGTNADSPEGNRTRFPSAHLWEDPWEAGLDLRRLRSKRRSIENMARLIEEPNAPERLFRTAPAAIVALVDTLDLESEAKTRLLEDSRLIVGWHDLPNDHAALQMGRRHEIEVLIRATDAARSLYDGLAPDAQAVEGLLHDMPALGDAAIDEIDLVELTRQLAVFVKAGRATVESLGVNKSGRNSDRRRNVAIILATQAVEEAMDMRVEITRKTDDWRFANEPGRYVRDLLALIGWLDERVLVGAFDKLRRKPRVKL